MNNTRGQEIAVSELRLSVHAISRRLVWSAISGLTIAFIVYWVFAPQALVQNLMKYLWASLALEVRKLPILGVRDSDIHHFVKASMLMGSQAYFWRLLLATFGVCSLSVFGLLTYLFWRRGEAKRLDEYKRGSQLLSVAVHNKIMRS